MKRWHEEFPRTYREYLKRKKYTDFWSTPGEEVRYASNSRSRKDKQFGRYRKMKPFDCGIPRCHVCHYDKYYQRSISYQEWCADLRLKEGMEELDLVHNFRMNTSMVA
jgi:hypothetical protein